MKEYKLIISPLAEVDINVAKDWYELQKENLGNEFVTKIGETLVQIRKNPNHFSQAQKNICKAIVNRFPFSIFYTVVKQTIIVFAVFHHSRNPIVWKNRLK